MTDHVPLREVMDAHHTEVTGRLDRIETRLDRIEGKVDGHKHSGLVPWAALVPMLVTLIVTMGLLS